MAKRRRCQQLLSMLPLAAAGPAAGPARAEARASLPVAGLAPLRMGVVPYLTARRLMKLFEPARAFFERDLGRPVRFYRAADFTSHLALSREQLFDITADALLFARLAQRENGHVPFARTAAPLEPVLVVRRGTPEAQLVESLRGQTAAVTDALGPLTIIALRFFRQQGLRPGVDIMFRTAGNQANSVQLLLLNQVGLAVVSKSALHQLEPAQAEQLRVLKVLPPALSTMVYTLAPRWASWAPALSRNFIRFASHEASGRAFIDALGHQGLLPVAHNELAQLDPLVLELQRQLAAQP